MLLLAATLAAGLGSASASGAGRQAAGRAAASREDAYRANNVGVALLEQFNYAEAADELPPRARDRSRRSASRRINLAIALFYVPDLRGRRRAAKEAAAAAPGRAAAALHPRPDRQVREPGRRRRRRVREGAGHRRHRPRRPRQPGAAGDAEARVRPRRSSCCGRRSRRSRTTSTALYNLGVALTRAGKTEEGQQTIAKFQALREAGYGTAFSNNYLEQGRYAEAVAVDGREGRARRRRRAAGAVLGLADAAAATRQPGRRRDAGRSRSATATSISSTRGARLRILDNDARRRSATSRPRTGLPALTLPAPLVAAVAGDYDNDERTDLFVLGARQHALLHQRADGTFEDATAAAGIPAPAGSPATVAFVDADHDGDLDLVVGGARAGPAAQQRQRHVHRHHRRVGHRGGGGARRRHRADRLRQPPRRRPADRARHRRAGAVQEPARRHVPRRRRRRRPGGAGAAPAGSPRSPPPTSTRTASPTSSSAARARPACSPPATGAARFTASPIDGLERRDARRSSSTTTTTACSTSSPPRRAGLLQVRNLGSSGPPADARRRRRTVLPLAPIAGADAAMASGDLDGDGDTDLVLRAPAAPTRAPGRADERRRQPAARRCASACRAGQQPQRRRARRSSCARAACGRSSRPSSASPAAAPADLVFGLGARARRRRRARALARRHPAGGAAAAADAPPPASCRTRRWRSTELDRKPSSCPYLYTWNGERFEFVTDFMGGGEMGYWDAPGVVGHARSRGVRAHRRRPAARRATAATSCASPTSSRRRCSSIALQLLAVDHPAAVEVYPNEGAFAPPSRRSSSTPLRDAAARRRARSTTPAATCPRGCAPLDRQFVGRLAARAHPRLREAARADARSRRRAGGRRATLLLLTGWTDYAFSSDNVAAHQAGLPLDPPSLQVRDADGALADGDRRDRHPGRPAADDRRRPVGQLRFVGAARGAASSPACASTGIRSQVADLRIAPSTPRLTTLDAAQARSALARLLGGGHAGRPRAVRLRLRPRLDDRRRGS